MAISSFFSSFLPAVYADAPEESAVKESQAKDEDAKDVKEENAAEGGEEKEEEGGAAEEEEEEEPEDLHPNIREECKETSKCAPATKHFQHCQEKVESGKGFKHEDCVEELCKSYSVYT